MGEITGYAPTPWPAEDGGPRRLQRVEGIPGPRATRATTTAVRQVALGVMVVHGPADRTYLLRADMGPDAPQWVEEIDPVSLEERRRSPSLSLGPFWPGGMAVLDDGSVLVVQGRWAHRLTPDLDPITSRRLPVEAPHNSFVLLGDGTVATKDLQRPDGPPSTLSLLDPATLEDRAAPVVLPEPSVSRLSADGDTLVVVGTSALSRHRWDGSALTAVDGAAATYLVHDDQSFGWDPVVADSGVWWMDNGDHTFADGLTMLGNGVAAGPTRLWHASGPTPDGADGADLRSVEISGRPAGAVTNPPLVDDERGLVVGFDSANGVLAAFATDDLSLVWRRDVAAAQHMWLHPDTGELVTDDHDREHGDHLVVLDVATGEERARARVDSPAQSVVFGAPGRHGDALFLSLSTLARVELAP